MRSQLVTSITAAVAILVGAVLLGAVPGLCGPTAPLDGRPVAAPAAVARPAGVDVAPALSPGPGIALVGPVPPTWPLDVAVGLASVDPSGLGAYVSALGSPGTPVYREPLSASAAAARFGASNAAVGAASAYFRGHGLTVTTAPDGLLLDVQGPSSRMGPAFGTSFDFYRLADGRTVVSHATPAILPALAPWTGAVGLGNVTPIAVPASVESLGPVAPAAGCSALPAGLAPCQIQLAYDSASLLANGTNGSGVRIGIVDAYSGYENESTLASDFGTFTAEAGLPSGNVNYLYPVPTNVTLNSSSTNPYGWPIEEPLDLEWARASAPGATLDMTFSPNPGAGLYAAIDWLVGHRAVDVISLSWGEPDVGIYNAFSMPCPSQCNASTDGSYGILGPVLELAAAEGISVFAASGDCGSADGTSGVSTNFPASDPYVTGVGGTRLDVGPAGTYLSETGWSGNQSGASPPGCVNGGGSGGGFSPFPRPWWQVGLASVPAGRGVPDVALDAAVPVDIVASGQNVGVAGTSVATPIWAGIAALADQAGGRDLGLLNPSLYRVAVGPDYHSAFHDVVSGGNGYQAGPGWDPVTGLGSPIVAALVPLLTAASANPSTLAAYVFASPRYGTAPLAASFALTVNGGTGTYPLEGIYFGDGNASSAVAGSARHTYPVAGVYSVQAYAVDSSGNATVSPPVVVVVGGGIALTVGLSVSNGSPAVDQNITLRATASGGTPPYLFDFFFGDGIYAQNLTSGTTNHSFGAVGAYCADVVAWDSAPTVDGGASARVGIGVGGASAGTCGNPGVPFSASGTPPPAPRDAPADFPSLFTSSGGSTAPFGVAPVAFLTSGDPYGTACNCAIFPAAGRFSVTEIVDDPVNGVAFAAENVTVGPPLTAQFSAAPLSGPAPLTVSFSATASGGTGADSAATHWSFGSAGATTGATAAHTYAAPGEYLVIASLADSGQGNASEAFLIDVEPAAGPPPLGIAATVAPAANVSSGATVAFTGTLLGPANATANDTLAWDLGGGRGGFGPSVNESYWVPPGGPGSDTLSLRVSADGPYFTPALSVPISLPSFFAIETGGFVPAATALSLASNVSPTIGVAPLTVHATSGASGPGGTSVGWSFGPSGTSSSGSTTRSLPSAGGYTVTATATDPFGDRATERTGVVVYSPLAIAGGPSPSGGSVPLTVDLTATASGGAGPPYSYSWSVDGAVVSTNGAVEVRLTTAGLHNVTVRVTDRLGDSARANWTILVNRTSSVVPEEILIGGAAAGAAVAALAAWGGRRSDPGGPR